MTLSLYEAIAEVKQVKDWSPDYFRMFEGPSEDERSAIAAVLNAYIFNLASVGGGKRPTDPVEVEAFRIARDQFATFAASKKLTVKAIKEAKGEDWYLEKIAALAERDDVVKEAKRRVKAREASAESALEGLDLDGIAPVEAEPAH